MKPLSLFLLLLILVSLTGCTSVDEMRRARGEQGSVEIFNAPYDLVFETAQSVLRFQGANVLDMNKDTKYIVAEQEMSYVDIGCFSYGEMLGIYFEVLEPQMTRVKMVEKKWAKLALMKQDWALEFFNMMRTQLKYKMQETKA